ncbi:MAG: cytochrome c maturation protein CcmE [Bacteroidetes bacterium]|nr:MAG: cytochrome c maturation protein CcmE [Bacteroidota bacterium]
MKKIHLIAILMIAAAIVLLTTAADDMSTYSNFADAATGEKVKISGHLAKDKEMYYNPEEDPNFFSFYVIDNEGVEKKVILKAAKPQDFERSEQIVLTGKMVGDEFLATELLMKCPSKYKDEEIYIKTREGDLSSR